LSLTSLLKRFARARQAAEAVEFAISSLALFVFFLAIINIGDLGLVLGTLQRAVEGSTREAAVVAAVDIAAKTACPSSNAVQQYFNNFASPGLPIGGVVLSSANGPLSLNGPWSNDAILGVSYLVLTSRYNWTPIGFAMLSPTITLSLTSMSFVAGTTSVAQC